MSTESKPNVSRGNNTTVSSATLYPAEKTATAEGGASPSSRGQRKRHDHIQTSDEELKKFNKGYHAKAQSQYMDPCQAQTKASIKCMDDNNYDKRKCTRFFKDYSDCKKKWMASLREERRKKNLGIVDDDETPEIKKDAVS
ncbi:Mitochondrial copper homeostasis protein [Dissophora globulifera]|uniref:Mitochondrial copper homeostasis protein n=1 Tax=Dissophora globulifera TaxID=979702 RepID=A0A9P6RTV6_9FUNG|nr:Mitochondrial copper homeostasis protein [Dissophora globulifera]KAG0327970.1 Mitochondrial copper homeostasis protein [Dissophora globulifera]